MTRPAIIAVALVCLASAPAAASAEPVADEAPVVVWNRTITILRAPYEQFSAADRARRAELKIRAIAEGERSYQVGATDATVGKVTGAWITVNGRPIFGLLTADADLASGETFEEYKQKTIAALEGWLAARADQRRWPLILRGVALALAATALWIFAVVLLVRLRRRWLAHATSAARKRQVMVGDVDLRPHIIALESGLLRFAGWAAGLGLGYLWLTFVLGQFPYSRPWGQQLREFLVDLVVDFAGAVIGAVPNLVKVLVIFLIARFLSRGLNAFLRAAETGAFKSSWLEPETARMTRRLIVIVIWLFALVLAYPYIPGSDTPAFQGLSVLLGLMVSLGATGLVGQIIGGLVMVYTRAFRTGDFVKVGEHEGVVVLVGMLSTKILTVRREEVTIPNAVLVGTTAVNYSRRAVPDGAVVATKLTIGYDAPWRQVHSMLLAAAERTAMVRTEPAPRVIQFALSDFYVEYWLLVNIDRAEDRYVMLSDLHANIQDAFNEHGVQIMSPAFESQPERKIVVPRSRWYAAPATPPADEEQDEAEPREEEEEDISGRTH